MPRPTIGPRAMTSTERSRRRRARLRREAATQDVAPPRPSRLVEFAASLRVTQGEHLGDHLEVLPWQAAWLRHIESMRGGEAALSVAAGAGKTTLAATLATAALCGPLAQPRADVLVVAASFRQATIAADHVAAFMAPELAAEPERWRVLRSEQRALIEDRATGARLEAREANARTLHGAAPVLVLADEPAQWQPSQREAIYSALRSRAGKIPGFRLLAIGTRSDDPAHWFAKLLRRNGTTYAAGAEDDPFAESTWHMANPSLRHFPALLDTYRREAEEAAADADLLPVFRALRLNLGTADHAIAVLVEAADWERCECDLLPARSGPMVLAFDLSGGDALAAASAYWRDTGRLEAIAAVPAVPDLAERSRTDAADYGRMRRDGDLLVLGGHVVPVAGLVEAALERWGRPVRVVADSHQQRELRGALADADFPPAVLVSAGLGSYADGGPRIRDFRRAVRGGGVYVAARLMWRQAMANARTAAGDLGDERLVKGGATGRKRTARDDVAVAAVLAVSEAARLPKRRRRGLRHVVAG